jgi:glycosyltransferase involved in cell wall biosynthesis
VTQSLTLSVVIPTHNRVEFLGRSLTALRHQSWPTDDFEVIVVADACEDETASFVQEYRSEAPFELKLIEHNARNPSATRNRGVSEARGKYILFLDDDVTPSPELLKAHLDAGGPNTVVLGYSKPVFHHKCDWWQQSARRWWEDAFRQMGQPGHRFTYRDFFSGNVSMPLELFHSVGGFDLSISGRLEDYELGIRLLEAGVKFKFEPEALGFHHEHTNLDIWLRRLRMEASANIQIGYQHPALRHNLFSDFQAEDIPFEGITARVQNLSFHHKKSYVLLYKGLLHLTHLSEKLRWRGPYWYTTRVLREMAYWGGVAECFDSEAAFLGYLQESPIPTDFEERRLMVDLASTSSVEALEKIFREADEREITVAFDGLELMSFYPEFGTENIEARHLFRELRERAQREFFPSPAFQNFLISLEEYQ